MSKTCLSLFAFIACFSAVAGLCTSIPSGYVGVYKTWQRYDVEAGVIHPSLVCYNPMWTSVVHVETRPQTDVVTNVKCGSSDGVILEIEKIEVGNQLSPTSVIETITKYGEHYDKFLVMDSVVHKLTEHCSKLTAQALVIDQFDKIDDVLRAELQKVNDEYSSGVTIRFVRLTKPRFPSEMQKHFMDLANEKTNKKVLEQKMESERVKKATEMLMAQKDNEVKMAAVEHQNRVMIAQVQARQEEQRINNAIIIESAKANAEKIMLEAQALRAMYDIPGYTEVEAARALSTNQKIYYGDKLPTHGYPLLTPSKE